MGRINFAKYMRTRVCRNFQHLRDGEAPPKSDDFVESTVVGMLVAHIENVVCVHVADRRRKFVGTHQPSLYEKSEVEMCVVLLAPCALSVSHIIEQNRLLYYCCSTIPFPDRCGAGERERQLCCGPLPTKSIFICRKS